MPFQLDTRIPLSVEPPQPFNGLAQLGQLRAQQQHEALVWQQIRSGQAVEEARRQDTAKQAHVEVAQQKFYDILASSKTPDEAAERIRVEAPEMHAPFLKQRAELDEKAASIKEKGLQATKLVAEIQAKGKEYSEPFMQLVEKSGYKPEMMDFARPSSALPTQQRYRQQAGGDSGEDQGSGQHEVAATANGGCDSGDACGRTAGKIADATVKQCGGTRAG
jgi:hypothetical protein